MDASADWLEQVSGQIRQAEGRLTSHRDRLKLALLLRSARRVTVYSEDCATCRALLGQIGGVASQVAAAGWGDGAGLGRNLAGVTEITRHLRLAHGLVTERHYVTRLVAGGLALGVSTIAAGLVLVNFGITLLTLGVTLPALVTRVAVSYTVGRWLDWRARRRGRLL